MRLLRRTDDWSRARGSGAIDLEAAQACLELWGIDDAGTDELDRRYLTTLAETYRGGPAGVEALAATIGEEARTLEDLVEPFLLQEGLVARTRSGRRLTDAGAHQIGWTPPDAQSLFGEDDR
jgi:Holliday junction DNA helicase RuvB